MRLSPSRREVPSNPSSPALKVRNRSPRTSDSPVPRRTSTGSLASTGSSSARPAGPRAATPNSHNPSPAVSRRSSEDHVRVPKMRSGNRNVPPNRAATMHTPVAARRSPAISTNGVIAIRGGGQGSRTESRMSAVDTVYSDTGMCAAELEASSAAADTTVGAYVPFAGQPENMGEAEPASSSLATCCPVINKLPIEIQGVSSANAGAASGTTHSAEPNRHTPITARSLSEDALDQNPSITLLSRSSSEPVGTQMLKPRRRSLGDNSSPKDGSGGSSGQAMAVRVVTRIRPRLKKELLPKGVTPRGEDSINVQVDGKTMVVSDGQGRRRQFTVDDVIDSRKDDAEGSQFAFFAKVGRELVQRALAGYNVCVFAYGHTGSGKTHTILGSGNAPVPTVRGGSAGLLPRFLDALHRELIERHQEPTFQCEFFEVYNERIRDLLAPPSDHGHQRNRAVHVHPKYGVHIEDLHPSEVHKIEDALDLIHFGNQMRTVASTTLNQRSSRSHAIFRFKFEHAEQEAGTGSSTERSNGGGCQSTVTFVDLAGRECHSQSGLVFKEMTYINTSLFYLAVVISKLADGTVQKGSLADFRNSKLTLLLSQALMGNCTTSVVTTVSPLSEFYDDTVSTLSFAQTVKRLQTVPVANKGRRDIIAELEAEVRRLRQELNEARIDAIARDENAKQIHAAETLMKQYGRDKKEIASISQQLARDRVEAAERIGLLAPSSPTGRGMQPFLTNLSSDPSLQGVCNYFLREGGSVKVGSDASVCDIVVDGVGIDPVMCEICISSGSREVGIRVLDNEDGGTARVLVNGGAVQSGPQKALHHRDCLMFGYSRSFRIIIPAEAKDSGFGDLDVESALSEMADTTGEQFKAVLPFLSQLQNRASKATAEGFIHALHKVCPLIDEANILTKEVRGKEPLRFELHALTDFFDYENDKPELVVCVLWDPKGLERLRKGVQTALLKMKGKRTGITKDVRDDQQLGHARIPLVHELDLDDQMILGRRGGHSLLYVWSLEKFLSRLQAIRELYEEGRLTGDNFQVVRQRLQEQRLMDPWHEPYLGAIHEVDNPRCMNDFFSVVLRAQSFSSVSGGNASETTSPISGKPASISEMSSETPDKGLFQLVNSPSIPSAQKEEQRIMNASTPQSAKLAEIQELPSPSLARSTQTLDEVPSRRTLQEIIKSNPSPFQKEGDDTIAGATPSSTQQGGLPFPSLSQVMEVLGAAPGNRMVQGTTASSITSLQKEKLPAAPPRQTTPTSQQVTEMIATASQLIRQPSSQSPSSCQDPSTSNAASKTVIKRHSNTRGGHMQERSLSSRTGTPSAIAGAYVYDTTAVRSRSPDSRTPPTAPPVLTALPLQHGGHVKAVQHTGAAHESPTVLRRAQSEVLIRTLVTPKAMPARTASFNCSSSTNIAGLQPMGGNEAMQTPVLSPSHRLPASMRLISPGSATANISSQLAREHSPRMVSYPFTPCAREHSPRVMSYTSSREQSPRMVTLPSKPVSTVASPQLGAATLSAPPPVVDFSVSLTDVASGQTICGAAMYLYTPPFPLDLAMRFGSVDSGLDNVSELFLPPPGWGILRSSAGLLIWLNLRACGSPSEAICERLVSALQGSIRVDFAVVGELLSPRVQHPHRVSINADVCGLADRHVAVLSDEGLLRFSGAAAIKVRLASCFDRCVKELFSLASRVPDRFPSRAAVAGPGHSIRAPSAQVTVLTQADMMAPPLRPVHRQTF